MNLLSRWRSQLGRPVVIAHRGASRAAPENSLAALRLARELGADAAEFDVQRCASGELVVFHDQTLGRCTGHVGRICDTPWSELSKLSLDRIDPARRGERIPLLDEWLAEAHAELGLNLEAKGEELSETGAASDAARALARAGRLESSILSAFHPASLAQAARAEPNLARGVLVHDPAGWQVRLGLGLLTRPQAIHPQHTLVTPARVAAWKRLGLAVATWTVDDGDEARRCLEAGVDALITNVPEVMRRLAETFAR